MLLLNSEAYTITISVTVTIITRIMDYKIGPHWLLVATGQL